MAAQHPEQDNLLRSTKDSVCGDVLTKIIIVIEKIFRCLTARQLNSCSQVCKVWYDQAKREKDSREQLRWNSFSADHCEAGDFDAQEWWTDVTTYIMDGPMEPSFVLIFCSDALCCHLSEVKQKKRKKNKADMHGLIAPILPEECSFQVIMSDGIVGTNNKMVTEELEEYELALSLIMFSKHSKQPITDLELVPFSFSYNECQALAKYWSEGARTPPVFMQPMLHKEIHMVNLFCPINGIDQEVGYSFLRMLQCPLIAGGYVNSKIMRDTDGRVSSSEVNSLLAGFAICGKSIRVASVLIKSNVDSEEEVDKLIRSLKGHDLPLNQTFGLMYACVGRGIHVYEKRNVESGVFRKHFPSTPLFGFFGNGEVGCCYPSPTLPTFPAANGEANGDGARKRPASPHRREGRVLRSASNKLVEAHQLKHPPKLLHAYTTVMCLVSILPSSSTPSSTAPR